MLNRSQYYSWPSQLFLTWDGIDAGHGGARGVEELIDEELHLHLHYQTEHHGLLNKGRLQYHVSLADASNHLVGYATALLLGRLTNGTSLMRKVTNAFDANKELSGDCYMSSPKRFRVSLSWSYPFSIESQVF